MRSESNVHDDLFAGGLEGMRRRIALRTPVLVHRRLRNAVSILQFLCLLPQGRPIRR